MAKMTKVVRDYTQNKLDEMINAELEGLNAEVSSFDQRLNEEKKIALAKANAVYRDHLKNAFPEIWVALEQESLTGDLPGVQPVNSYRIHNPFKAERDHKREQLAKKARQFMTELIIDYELGGMKKDELLAAISKFAER